MGDVQTNMVQEARQLAEMLDDMRPMVVSGYDLICLKSAQRLRALASGIESIAVEMDDVTKEPTDAN